MSTKDFFSVALPDSKKIFSHPTSMPVTPPPEDLLESLLFTRPSEHSITAQLDHRPTVAVIGVGYVGQHLVEAFSTAYNVIAFDISQKRIEDIKQTFHAGHIHCTSDARDLSRATHFLIAVTTVLNHLQQVDTSYLKSAISTVEQHARPGSTVVIESSVAVGMTRELLKPLVRSKSLKCGMSPERVDPGRVFPHYSSIPKLISGLDFDSVQSIHALYAPIFHNLVPVSSPEVAEMTKLYENCQRMVCIAYANEMADACRQLSENLSGKCNTDQVTIDPYEVARAASTKPFGYMSYYPSLGVGGHCIPVNPHYLLSNASFPLLESCTQRMRERPGIIGDRIMSKITGERKRRPQFHRTRKQESRVLVVGMGFKRGQSTLSNSPGQALATHLLQSYDGVYVEYADPLVDEAAMPGIPKLDDEHDWNVKYLSDFDAIIVAVDQPGLDLSLLEEVERRGVYVESFCRS